MAQQIPVTITKVERLGMGVPQMKAAMALAGLKEPVFDMDGFFRAVFFRPKREDVFPASQKIGAGLVEGLVENQRKMLDLMKKDSHVSKKELSLKLGISSTAIDKNIVTLKKKGLLRRIGPDKGGHWRVS